MRFNLQRVQFMPKDLQPGVLYVAEEFGAAAHLCACGCGSKVRTPLGPTEWTVWATRGGPTLWPSVGNWQKPCRSHYVIDNGEVIWCRIWSEAEVIAGRHAEAVRRERYYSRRSKWMQRATDWLAGLFRR